MLGLILLAVALVAMLCVLAYTLATYALPFMFGLAAARFAYATGAGVVGAGIVGCVAGVVAFGVFAFLFCRLQSPGLRFLVMFAFVAPAAVAGYELIYGVAREAVPSEIWRRVFSVIGGIFVGCSALLRLTLGPKGLGTGGKLRRRV